MNDKDREWVIGFTEAEIKAHRFGQSHESLDVSVKDCPKCKHPVVAQTHSRYVSNIICWTDYYQCLTCGSKFTCSEKCVCELIKDAD